MDHADFINDIFYLVGLKMTDQMPSYRFYFVILVHYLLDFVLADISYAAVYGLVDLLRAVKLCHRHQKHVIAAAPRSFGRSVFKFSDMFYVCLY